MSEEGIIDNIKLYLRHADVFFEIPGREHVSKNIKDLLDLYNKEKEKNERGIKALEILRQDFSEDLQPDFIYIIETLKGEIKC